jgi:hypothetical protein
MRLMEAGEVVVAGRDVPTNVRYWHKADMRVCTANVRYWG